MRTMLYLLAFSIGLGLAAGRALAEADPGANRIVKGSVEGNSRSAGDEDYDPDQYDPQKHIVDKRNLGNRPVWWWTHPMCRPKWRSLDNCTLDGLDDDEEATGPDQPDK